MTCHAVLLAVCSTQSLHSKDINLKAPWLQISISHDSQQTILSIMRTLLTSRPIRLKALELEQKVQGRSLWIIIFPISSFNYLKLMLEYKSSYSSWSRYQNKIINIYIWSKCITECVDLNWCNIGVKKSSIIYNYCIIIVISSTVTANSEIKSI